MNREIRFRAWDKNEEQMVEVFQTTFPPVSDLVLMQFTGFKASDGLTDIYEGDILETDVMINQTVEWDQARGMWIVNGTENLKGQLSHWNGEARVVGNIYANPELLNN